MVKLATENEKDRLMSSLMKLKNAEDRFRKISVAHDFSATQREAIKSAITETKQADSDVKEERADESTPSSEASPEPPPTATSSKDSENFWYKVTIQHVLGQLN